MFGLDDWIAGLSDGASVGVVLFVAVLLGLRHATDPDHIAAMTTLVASGRERVARSAAELGAWWGIGHGITLVVFGLPILLVDRLLARAHATGCRDGSCGAHRLPRASTTRAVAAWVLRPPRASTRGARSPTCCAHPVRVLWASGSYTGWAEAPASACCSLRRSLPRQLRSSRSCCSRSSRRSR